MNYARYVLPFPFGSLGRVSSLTLLARLRSRWSLRFAVSLREPSAKCRRLRLLAQYDKNGAVLMMSEMIAEYISSCHLERTLIDCGAPYYVILSERSESKDLAYITSGDFLIK